MSKTLQNVIQIIDLIRLEIQLLKNRLELLAEAAALCPAQRSIQTVVLSGKLRVLQLQMSNFVLNGLDGNGECVDGRLGRSHSDVVFVRGGDRHAG